MFSRKEREFLSVLGVSPPERAAALLQERFPSPGYRRRLFWGIRRKVAEVVSDLDLYARAAELEGRVVRPVPLGTEPPVLAYDEPIAALVQRVAQSLRRPAQSRRRTERDV